MKHVTFADKSLLVGDEAADLVMKYAAALATAGRADTVDIHAYSSDGDDTTATFLLNEGSPLMAETSHSQLPDPDNVEAVAYMQAEMLLLENPPTARAVAPPVHDPLDELYL